MPEYSSPAASLSDLLGECFRLNSSLLAASRQLTEDTGITGAQWGVLTSLGLGGDSRTVAETARQMGHARQSVQRVADVLAEKGLLRYSPNPRDKRAKLADVTEAGKALLEQLEIQQRVWIKGIAPDSSTEEINIAFQLVKKIRQRME
jgi:DNA-binding MarR family transcriptional regulator